MTEILNRQDTSCMQSFVDELVHQTSEMEMLINTRKKKKMFVSRISKDPPPPVTLSGELVETVTTLSITYFLRNGTKTNSDIRKHSNL